MQILLSYVLRHALKQKPAHLLSAGMAGACYTFIYMAGGFSESLNLKKSCAEYRVGLWQCPQFLFLIMGAVIISAIMVTYIVASRYEEPEIASLVVLVLAAILFAIGNL